MDNFNLLLDEASNSGVKVYIGEIASGSNSDYLKNSKERIILLNSNLTFEELSWELSELLKRDGHKIKQHIK